MIVGLHDRWIVERQNEHYYKLAKKLDYRSRASFKLIQIDDRFQIFRLGDSVVDLGACPGGWLQVAKERVGETGKVVGVDLRYIYPLEGVETFVGDITEDKTMIELLTRFGGKADVVLSDMAPNIAGHYSTDHARSVNLCMYAVDVCDRILKKNGKMVCKVFMGDLMDSLTRELEKRFQSVKVYSPDASRETSSEVYVVSKGFLANHRVKLKVLEEEENEPDFKTKGPKI
ncbi:MAG: RlmE family RNA methyltransferase [Candidatus Methanomethylophilaceae archaeon]|nr:RlmE family RNA methyltransferase [Candidatus Methanomethylophilaceae archaeon]MDY0225139.1 RlmE family RNA methyltransferase [Candidatus Methanomethylophilaceae archaeon]